MHHPRLIATILGMSLLLSGCQLFGANRPAVIAPPPPEWGVDVNLFPFPNLLNDDRFHEVAEQQIQALKDLDVTTVRFTYSPDVPERSIWFAKRLKEEDMNVLVIVEDYLQGPQPNEFDHGYQFAKQAAQYMAPYADYYQLANEIGGSAIKGPQYNGTTLDQYDQGKLNQTLDFVAGAAKAIGEVDPTARRVVTINNMHTAIIAEAIKRNIPFEILGWNWFSDFGTDLDHPIMNQSTGERYNFYQTLHDFHKTLWVTELSRRGGANDKNEQAQADFLTTAVPIAHDHNFTGIFPFVLVEDVVGLPGYGLVRTKKDRSGTWSVDDHRQAFDNYKELIAHYE